MSDSRKSAILWFGVIVGLMTLAIWQSLDLVRPGPQPGVIGIGDELPEVILDSWHLDEGGRQRKGKATSSRAMFSGKCGVAVFFEATCHGCEVIAPKWTAIHEIERGGRRVEVVWISLKTDDSAQARFVSEFGVGPSWLAFRSVRDRRHLGVFRWPSVLVLDGRGRVVSMGAFSPDEVEVPASCSPERLLGFRESSVMP